MEKRVIVLVRVQVLGALFVCAMLAASCAHPGKRAASPLSPGEHVVVSKGADIHYHVFGGGPVIVAYPGGPGFSWDYLRMPLLERTFAMVYVEPVGSGASGRLPEEQYTMRRYLDDLEEIRQALGVDKFVLLGHSFGGLVAQQYAIEHPDALSGLILYSTYPTLGKEWMDGLPGRLKRFEKKPWYNEAVKTYFGAVSLADEVAGNSAMATVAPLWFADFDAHGKQYLNLLGKTGFNPAPLRAFFSKESATVDTRGKLGRITAPTLIIAGAEDAILDAKNAYELKEGVSRSQSVTLKRSGHISHIETPTEFAAAVRVFVREAK